MSLKQRALNATFWTAMQQFGTQGIAFVVSVIMARLLMPEDFGLIAMIGVFITIGTRLMDAGLSSSLIRTQNPDQEDYSTVFFFNLMGSIIIYLLLFWTAPYIAQFYNQPLLTNIVRIYGITFIINSFGTIQSTRLTKNMDFKTLFKVSLPSLITGGIVGIFLALKGFGVWSLVFYQMTQTFFNVIQLWHYSKWKPNFSFNNVKFKRHFNFGYKMTISGILDSVFINLYPILIGKYFHIAQVGFYQRADSLKQLPVSNLGSIIDKVTYPLFSEIQKDDLKLKEVNKKIMQLVIFIIAPVLLLMGVLAEPLIRFLFTEKWMPAVPYFQILLLSGILYPIHAYNLNILKVKGRSDLFLKLEVFKKINIVLAIVVSFRWGIYGLLWANVYTSVTAYFINTYYTGKLIQYGAWQQTKDFIPILIIALIMGILVYVFDFYLQHVISIDFIRLLLGSILGVFIYIVMAFTMKLSTIQDLKQLIPIKK